MGPGSHGVKHRGGVRLCGLIVLSVLSASPLSGQEPPDTVVVDPGAVLPDSLLPDSLAADTLPVDSLSADTIFYNVPRPRGRAPWGFATGIWQWDRHSIMASGANTLAELFQDVPGLIPLLGGDYGSPAAMSSFGQGSSAYRVLRDGFEVTPLDGGVADLQRVGLVGIGSVRLERSMGQMVVIMRSLDFEDGRTFSVIEAGTGDLDTNMFRGTFTDPTAIGGSIAVGLERIDTRGSMADRSEGGNRTGTWVRYFHHRGDDLAVGVEYRRNQTQTRVDQYVPGLSRTDMLARAAWRPVEAVTLSGYAGQSSLDVDAAVVTSALGGTRSQYGGGLAVDWRALWLDGWYRTFAGSLPEDAIEVTGGYDDPRIGGVSGRFVQSTWNGTRTQNYTARAWLTPFREFTLFGSVSDGTYGAPESPVTDGAIPPFAQPETPAPGNAVFTDRRTLRAGAALALFGVELGGAWLYVSDDVGRPIGTELDLGSPTLPGTERNGIEGTFVLPTRWRAFTIEGSYQRWQQPGAYLPEQIYRGSFEYHRVFKETGNLEVWGSLGVRGHDPMSSFVSPDVLSTGLADVPFYQNWYARAQVRVVTVRLWIGIDNMTLRRGNQIYPDRILPLARSFFALRWDLWN